MPVKIALTQARIAAATCPAGREQVFMWDSVQHGLVVRVYPSGHKTYLVRYRPGGGGRAAAGRWHRLGDAMRISLKDARDACRIVLGEVAKGRDPSEDRRREQRRKRLSAAFEMYEKALKRRGVVKCGEVMSTLRRGLAALGDPFLEDLGRSIFLARIAALEADGRPGAAQELRVRCAVFLNWAVNQGMIPASPLAGLRRPRRTRAERVEQPGRALGDSELATLWKAAEAQGWPFGRYLQTLLLTGQRRTETAVMRWRDLDLEAGTWTIPAGITKSGRAHRVPLPAALVAIVAELPRLRGSELVFPGRHGAAMTGWGPRLRPVREATAAAGMEDWTLHDLRRTMRSGLAELGVDEVVAELLLNHAVSDDLQKRYDRAERWTQRVDAAEKWAEHVLALVAAKPKGAPRGRRGTSKVLNQRRKPAIARK